MGSSLAGKLSGGNVRYAATSAPTFTSITPDHGPANTATDVTIVGANFTPGRVMSVLIDGEACSNVVVVDDTTITCTTPSDLTVGAKAVKVVTRGGSFNQAAAYDSQVSVTSVTPDTGDAAGGTSVTIAGKGFTGATGVTFDGSSATSLVVVSDTSITCDTPAHAAGAVDVVVTTPGGSGTGINAFTYA